MVNIHTNKCIHSVENIMIINNIFLYLFLALHVMLWSSARGFQSKAAVFRADSSRHHSLPIAQETKQNLFNIFDSQSVDNVFVCPESLNPVKRKARIIGFNEERFWTVMNFETFRYEIKNGINDFTIKSEIDKPIWTLSTRERVGQGFFQNPFISYLYERGYRENFERSGFPGIEKEFTEVNSFFTSSNASVIMDLSCASGFMTRRFASSGQYNKVIAADLSLTMLQEARQQCLSEKINPLPEFIRCDAAKLPLKSATLDGIHAGAAMHCWPKLEEALAEIHRVLKPGGKFYASTFLAQNNIGLVASRRLGGKSGSTTGFYIFEDEIEIKNFLVAAGFRDSLVEVRREGGGCAIVKAEKEV